MGGKDSKQAQNFTPYDSSNMKTFPVPTLPKDAEGFVQSFTVDQEEAYIKFFNEFGFVVIDKILSPEQTEATIETIWNIIEGNQWGFSEVKVRRNDPTTWTSESWPSRIRSLGILGDFPAVDEQAWSNRQNPDLFKVFSTLMKREDLWVSVDRYGVMRPTVDVPNFELPEVRIRTDCIPPPDWKEKQQVRGENKEEEEEEEKENEEEEQKEKEEGEEERKLESHPKWKTVNGWAHWDLNPWKWCGTSEGLDYEFSNFLTENNGSRNTGDPKLQGLINLIDSRENDGGFCTVPGFHKHLKEWTELTSVYSVKSNFEFVNVPKGDPITTQLQPITCRAGSLIVWNSEQPHCNYPNTSQTFRMNQYVKMFPAQPKGKGIEIRKEMMQEILPKDFKITELGRKLFGLSSW